MRYGVDQRIHLQVLVKMIEIAHVIESIQVNDVKRTIESDGGNETPRNDENDPGVHPHLHRAIPSFIL